MNPIKHLAADIVSLLFPQVCAACGLSLAYGEQTICTPCLYDLPYTDFHLNEHNQMAKQFWGRLPIDAAMALFYFTKGGKVQSLIHHLKYNGRRDLGLQLGKLLASRLQLSKHYKTVDYIVPVPLHLRKERIRGYNQAMLIAGGISQVLNLPVKSNLLLRNKFTVTQTQKSRYHRYENIDSAFFTSHDQLLMGKHILLVDDVMSTGATLEACGNSLFNSGIKKLSIATVAFS